MQAPVLMTGACFCVNHSKAGEVPIGMKSVRCPNRRKTAAICCRF